MPNFDAIRIGVIKKIKGEAIAISRDGNYEGAAQRR